MKADYATSNAAVAFFGALMIERVWSVQRGWERTTLRARWVRMMYAAIRQIQVLSFAWFTIGHMRSRASDTEVFFAHSLGALTYYISITTYHLFAAASGAMHNDISKAIVLALTSLLFIDETFKLAYDYTLDAPVSRVIVQSIVASSIPLCALALQIDRCGSRGAI